MAYPSSRPALALLLALASACVDRPVADSDAETTAPSGDPSGDPSGGPTGSGPPTTTVDPSGITVAADPTFTTEGPPPADGPLCTHLGGLDGVGELLTTFLGLVLTDDRINAYFLTSDLDWAALGTCLIDQFGEAAGCAGATYTCRSMRIAHQGRGVSMQDFNDFAEDFTKALDTHRAIYPDVTQDDIDTLLGLFVSFASDIVEDPDDQLTIYQRVGRKPALQALVGFPDQPGSFVANVAADPSIVGFFAATDFERLHTCLLRQLHSLDGPNTYGRERDDFPSGVDPGATAANPCRDMAAAHTGLVDDMGVGVETSDFAALFTALATAMTDARVSPEDQSAIAGVLGPVCKIIVAVDPENCP